MKKSPRLAVRHYTSIFFVLISLMPRPAAAAETAIVEKDKINVRGQPSLAGEVIAKLRKGTPVTILEEIDNPKAHPGEPKAWARIALPTNTHAWVNASFIDPTNKTVVPRRLNVRSGPSENYSVIGRLDRGTAVNEIRAQNGWSEIEPPANGFAFVALDTLSRSTNVPAMTLAAAPAPAATAPAPPPPVPADNPPKVEPPPEQPAVKPEEKPLVTEAKPEVNPAVAAAVPAAPLTVPDAIPIPAVNTATNVPPAAASTTAAEPPPKRIVRREGLVRRTTSIQAPTYFELENTETGKTMNYLHTSSGDINLKEYRGYRVVVSGEEYLDVRWRTPVIEVETLQVIP